MKWGLEGGDSFGVMQIFPSFSPSVTKERERERGESMKNRIWEMSFVCVDSLVESFFSLFFGAFQV